MAFKAQRDGVCIKCQKPIKGGVDYISWRRTKSGPTSGEAWHYPLCSPVSVVTTAETEPSTPLTGPAPGASRDGFQVEKALQVLLDAVNAKKESAALDLEGITKHVEHVMLDKRREIVDNVLAQVQKHHDDTSAMVEAKLSKFRPALDLEGITKIAREEINKRLVRTLVIEEDKREPKKFDLAHEDLPMLIKLSGTRTPSGHRVNIYMHGEAGSGKSTAARQVADALNLRFGYSSLNPMTPDSRALGFMHAGGEYVSTEFFKCYTEGGVFCFDEIDNASASFVTTLNSALENGHGAFPHGVFARHKDFLCVCTANTIGRGGDVHYPERRALDSAFLERFVFVEWAYDEKLTRAIVGGILGDEAEALMLWVKDKSDDLKNRFPELVISPRAFIQSALLKAQGFDNKFIEAAAISRGLKNA